MLSTLTGQLQRRRKADVHKVVLLLPVVRSAFAGMVFVDGLLQLSDYFKT